MTDTPRPYPEHYVPAVEALLFAADEPLTTDVIADALGVTDETIVPETWARAIVDELAAGYRAAERGFAVVEINGGFELRTRALFGDYVRHLYKKPPVRLSRAALEVLAIVAYRQPATRAQVEDVRGVDCSGMLRKLAEKELIKVIGKADEVGRPLLYGTSPKFLEFFGLAALTDLPTLREYTELTDDHVVKLQALEETLAANRESLESPTPDDSETDDVPAPFALSNPNDATSSEPNSNHE